MITRSPGFLWSVTWKIFDKAIKKIRNCHFSLREKFFALMVLRMQKISRCARNDKK